ncbi:glycosyltransferase [Rhizorhabdus phycosphaerae]|uniref:glycosyltransferase n=1 Tax=Rhizorhabdus phycosphaerae TaxID=2711156 RepID=UPI0013EBF231|nr:glycosyltransferase [Rhizorhabdus phycosphaerae]
MTEKNYIDLFYPAWSTGLEHCALVIQSAIRKLSGGRITVRPSRGRMSLYEDGKRDDPPPGYLAERGRVAIFIERVFERSFLKDYKSRILIPNPEWFLAEDVDRAGRMVDAVFHRNRFSMETLSPHLPNARHHQVGFTSRDPGITVREHRGYAHFRGKAPTRHSQILVDLWAKRPDLPLLSVQAYGSDIGIKTGKWIGADNLRMFLGFFPTNEQYFQELAASGIHLCTSATEGFGHYINESRAMGAVIVALDAPPMNELVRPDFGILVPTIASSPLNMGQSFDTTMELLEEAVDRVESLTLSQRGEMGAAAREAYVKDQQQMLAGLTEALSREWN